MNSKLSSKFGTPHNVSTGTGGRTTKAASRPAVNQSVKGGKFLPGADTYGTKGVGK